MASVTILPSASAFYPRVSEKSIQYSYEEYVEEQPQQDALCNASWTGNWNQFQDTLKFAPHYQPKSDDEELVEVDSEGIIDLNFHDSRSFAALHYTCSSGSVEMTEALLAVGCSDDVRDNNGNTPLIVAASQPQESEEHLRVLIALIEHGANPNSQNFHGETALHLAALNGNKSMVTFLVENGASINCKNLDGSTPLLMAISAFDAGGSDPEGKKNLIEVIAYLIGRGAFVNSQDDDGDSALHYAVRNGPHCGELFQLLLKAGCDVDLVNEDDESSIELAKSLGEDQLANFLTQYSRVLHSNINPSKQRVGGYFVGVAPSNSSPVATNMIMPSMEAKFPVVKNEGSALSSFHTLQVPIQQQL